MLIDKTDGGHLRLMVAGTQVVVQSGNAALKLVDVYRLNHEEAAKFALELTDAIVSSRRAVARTGDRPRNVDPGLYRELVARVEALMVEAQGAPDIRSPTPGPDGSG